MASIEHLRAQEKAELFGIMSQLDIPYDSEHGKYLTQTVPNLAVQGKTIFMAFADAFRKMIEAFFDTRPDLVITTEDAIFTPPGTRLRFPDKMNVTSHLHRDNNDDSDAFAKWERFTTTNPRSRKQITQYRLSYWGTKPDGSRTNRVKWLPETRSPGYIVQKWEVHTLIGRKGINVNKVVQPFEDERRERPNPS